MNHAKRGRTLAKKVTALLLLVVVVLTFVFTLPVTAQADVPEDAIRLEFEIWGGAVTREFYVIGATEQRTLTPNESAELGLENDTIVLYSDVSTVLYFYDPNFETTDLINFLHNDDLILFCTGDCGWNFLLASEIDSCQYNNGLFYVTLTETGTFVFRNTVMGYTFVLIVEGDEVPNVEQQTQQVTPAPTPQPSRPTSVPSLPQYGMIG